MREDIEYRGRGIWDGREFIGVFRSIGDGLGVV